MDNKDESNFTDLKSKIVCNKTLAEIANILGFTKYAIFGKNQNIDNLKEKTKADLLEAIIGAIAIDSDWDSVIIQHSIEIMLNINNFLNDEYHEEEIPLNLNKENVILTH